jgi:transposase
MFIVGFDIGKRKSAVCVCNEQGEVVEEFKVETKTVAIQNAFAKYKGRARVLVEASTSSEWVARLLEKELDLEVIIANPRFDLMYAQRDKKVKNDRRDARALAQALRLNAYEPIHRRSDAARRLQSQLLLREALVESRTKLCNIVRSIAQMEGVILDACSPQHLPELVSHDAEPALLDAISPALIQIESLNETIQLMEREFEEQSLANPVTKLLRTVHGVGPLTSLAFFAVIDDVKRFESSRQVSAYIGLVPSEYNTGGSKRSPGAITKAGNRMLRTYLVEAAFNHTMKKAPSSNLKSWRDAMVLRRGKKSKKPAAIAVARRLSRILFAMWRDMKPFDDARTEPVTAASEPKAA